MCCNLESCLDFSGLSSKNDQISDLRQFCACVKENYLIKAKFMLLHFRDRVGDLLIPYDL